jgi:hypothetical protein
MSVAVTCTDGVMLVIGVCEVAMSFVLSASPSVHTEKRGSHQTDFCEIGIFTEICPTYAGL